MKRLSVILVILLPIICKDVYALEPSDFRGLLSEYESKVSPSVISTPTRNGYSFGSYSARYPIVPATNLANFEPPSINAGCGGIDIFGGSFDMINKDQAVALMRAIMANASGYAMQLALEGLCPTCNQIMTQLKNTIDALNKLSKDSCALAKLAVDGGNELLSKGIDNAQDLINDTEAGSKSIEVAQGVRDGIYSSYTDGTDEILGGLSKIQDILDIHGPSTKELMVGNPIYYALIEYGVFSQGTNSSTYQPSQYWNDLIGKSPGVWTQDDVLSLAMTFFGVVTKYFRNADEAPNVYSKSSTADVYAAHDGQANVGYVACKSATNQSATGTSYEYCNTPEYKTGGTFEGIYTMVNSALNGEGTNSVGILKKLSISSIRDESRHTFFDASELAFYESLSPSTLELINQLKGRKVVNVDTYGRYLAALISYRIVKSDFLSLRRMITTGLSLRSAKVDEDVKEEVASSYIGKFKVNSEGTIFALEKIFNEGLKNLDSEVNFANLAQD